MSANGYTSGVSPFQKGQPLSARQLEKMREADQRALPMKGVGTMIKQTPNGTIVTSTARSRRGGAASPFPFKLSEATDELGTKIAVKYGIVVDASDPDEVELIEPTIGGLSISDPLSKLAVGLGTNGICIRLKQLETGKLDPLVEIITTQDTTVLANVGEFINILIGWVTVIEVNSVKIMTIKQAVGSHVIFPLPKPSFMHWIDIEDSEQLCIGVSDSLDPVPPTRALKKISINAEDDSYGIVIKTIGAEGAPDLYLADKITGSRCGFTIGAGSFDNFSSVYTENGNSGAGLANNGRIHALASTGGEVLIYAGDVPNGKVISVRNLTIKRKNAQGDDDDLVFKYLGSDDLVIGGGGNVVRTIELLGYSNGAGEQGITHFTCEVMEDGTIRKATEFDEHDWINKELVICENGTSVTKKFLVAYE